MTQLATTADARGIQLTASAAETTTVPSTPEPAPTETQPTEALIVQTTTLPAVTTTDAPPSEGISLTLTQLATTAETRGLHLTAPAAETTFVPSTLQPGPTEAQPTESLIDQTSTPPTATETDTLPTVNISLTLTQLATTAETRGLQRTASAAETTTVPSTPEPDTTASQPTEPLIDLTATAPAAPETDAPPIEGISLTLTQLATTAETRGLQLTALASESPTVPSTPEPGPTEAQPTESLIDHTSTALAETETDAPPTEGISLTLTQLAMTAEIRGLQLTTLASESTTLPSTPEPSPTAAQPTEPLIDLTATTPALIETDALPTDGISLTLTQLATTADVRGLPLTASAAETTFVPSTSEPVPTEAQPTKIPTVAESDTLQLAPDMTPTSPTATPATMLTETVVVPTETESSIETPTAGFSPTPSGLSIATATPTQILLPSIFAHMISTPTPFGATDAMRAPPCEVSAHWHPYAVQAGDTLASVAWALDISLIELREGNCFATVRGIFEGETLLVPILPALPIATSEPVSPSPDLHYPTVGCESPSARIDSPQAMTELQSIFAVIGSVSLPADGFYRIDVKPAWADSYLAYLESDAALNAPTLALINTEIFGVGLHRLRLSVMDSQGTLIDGGICDIPLLFVGPMLNANPTAQP